MLIFDIMDELVSSNLYHLVGVDTWDSSMKNKDLCYCFLNALKFKISCYCLSFTVSEDL